MTKYSILSLFAVLLLFSCGKEIVEADLQTNQDPMTRTQITDLATRAYAETGVVKWEKLGTNAIWSALNLSDNIMTIGYKPADINDVASKIHTIDITDSEWIAAKEDIIAFIIEEENKFSEEPIIAKDILLYDNETLPYIGIKVTQLSTVEKLADMATVRYAEPMGYSFEEEKSGSGCGLSPASYVPSADYTSVSPNAIVPWNFYHMNIPAAWNHTTGDGVAACIIDTGVSPDQSKLNNSFASGYSQNRSIYKYGTYVSSWWPWANPDGPDDDCGHGTQMSGTLAAPRGYGGSNAGVAYNADLVVVRGTGDVIVNGSSEKNGVANGLVIAGNRSDVKVISMSIGDVFWSGTVADGIYYAYNKGKMLCAAGGTSTWFTSWVGVIFPASMSQTLAITGVTDAANYEKCEICHSGSAIDFTVVMERANDSDRHSLTLAMSGNAPAYVGGSSTATATMAGIATLVWSTNPSLSRNQVLTRLKNASENYPSRDNKFGWGLVDAEAAVLGN